MSYIRRKKSFKVVLSFWTYTHAKEQAVKEISLNRHKPLLMV